MGLYNVIKNKVMGLIDKQKNKKNVNQQLTKLSEEEIKYLIALIGRSDFKGIDLTIVYSITAKLQNKLKI
jgi:hypothetical protein